jgi:predicted enzyme related to lactoylglutathione lyase
MKIKLLTVYVDDQERALRLFEQNKEAAMFYCDDLKAECERIQARGGQFVMPPTDVTGATIARLNDTCGNRIQLTQLKRWS